MLPEINWPESGCCWPLAFSNLRELQGSSAVERHAVSPAFLNRSVATWYCGQDSVRTKGSFIWNIDDTGDLWGRSISRRVTLATDRRRSGFPISCPDTLSIVGIPQTFTHAAVLIRSGSVRTNARARVRKYVEKGRNSRNPAELGSGSRSLEAYWVIAAVISNERANLRARDTPLRLLPSLSRSRILSLFTRFALGNRNLVHRMRAAGDRTVGTHRRGIVGTPILCERNRAAVTRTSHLRSDRTHALANGNSTAAAATKGRGEDEF